MMTDSLVQISPVLFQPSSTRLLFGRDVEILQIEMLLQERSAMLLTGMEGVGKSRLLEYLGDWWKRTGFVDDFVKIDCSMNIPSVTDVCNILTKKCITSGECMSGKQLEIKSLYKLSC